MRVTNENLHALLNFAYVHVATAIGPVAADRVMDAVDPGGRWDAGRPDLRAEEIALARDGRPSGDHAAAVAAGVAADSAPGAGSVSAPMRTPRLIALVSARSVAVTMFASRPTP